MLLSGHVKMIMSGILLIPDDRDPILCGVSHNPAMMPHPLPFTDFLKVGRFEC